VIEIMLRLAVIEQKGVVDHHEVHVGITPIDDEIAEQEKREHKAGDERGQPSAPACHGQAIKRVS
jgi:hypothetical protein